MLQKTEGLVIRSVRYAESSVITGIFTREFGLLSFHVPGVRSSRNKMKGNLFQPLQYLELDIYHHAGKNLMKIKEYKPAFIYKQLYLDIIRQSVGIFMMDVLGKCLHAEECQATLYDEVRTMLIRLDESNQVDSLLPSRFMQMLGRHLGFHPGEIHEGEYFYLTEGQFYPEPGHPDATLDLASSSLMRRFLTGDVASFSASERQVLLEAWISFFKVHVPSFSHPLSVEVLQKVLH